MHDKKIDPAHADRLDKPERKKELPPEKLLELVAPFAGMVFADIGVGTGYGFFPIVEAAQGQGTFYAVDSQEEMLAKFRERLAEHRHAAAVEVVLTPDDRLALPDDSLDTVLLVSAYHELPDRAVYGREIFRTLKSGGRVVIIDWPSLAPGEERVVGPPEHHRVSAAQAVAELAEAGFTEITEHQTFDKLWAVTAKKR